MECLIQTRPDKRDEVENSFTGQWGPKTKIWLRAMSTRFQASAKLSWSGAEAFVPGKAERGRSSEPGPGSQCPPPTRGWD